MLGTKLAALILAGLLTGSAVVPVVSNDFDTDGWLGGDEGALFSTVGLEESLEELFGYRLSERLEDLFLTEEEKSDSFVLGSILDWLISEREEASTGGGSYEDHTNDNNGSPLVLEQQTEQEAESGEMEHTFEVSSSGDNSNQSAPIQGVSNTGNAQNVIDISQSGSKADDFGFEEVGSTVEVSPTLESTSHQEVDQAASASG
jgi:hypothetical protein